MTDFGSRPDWAIVQSELARALPGPDTDERIDILLEELRQEVGSGSNRPEIDLPNEPGLTPALLAAFDVARSESTRRDVAFTLARWCRAGDTAVVDALGAAYRAARDDGSLGPELLRALSVLAARDPTARADLVGAIGRVRDDDSRYLVIRAAKIIGRLEAAGVPTHARRKLEEWAAAPDLAVQAEARQQLALLSLAEAIAQPNLELLRERLQDCRAAFARAELSEELRHDARRFSALVELLLVYLAGDAQGVEDHAALRDRATILKAHIDEPSAHPWPGYASDSEAVVEYRLYRIATGFLRLASEMDAMAGWTNFDAALGELAAAWLLMWSRATSGDVPVDREGALPELEHVVVLPRLGSLLERAIGRQRLAKVVEGVERTQGTTHPVTTTLRAFYESACRAEREPVADAAMAVDVEAFTKLAASSPATAARLVALVPGAEVALRAAGLDVTPDGTALRAYRVPTDHPSCYGNDPSVDDAVRPVLDAAWERLAPRFSPQRWSRFRDLLVFLVQLARDLRNDLPEFVRAAEDGGKGQSASEADLQAYVFTALRREYGRGAVWEASKIAGGRVDSGVHFAECDIPVEVKAEYRDVSREHVRNAYLAQADHYAAERDRVAFLLILDLREAHASSHRKRRDTSGTQPRSVYSLAAGFWVDGLTVDPQVANAEPNAVVIGLFPGNQPTPSSMTAYSSRPRGARSR